MANPPCHGVLKRSPVLIAVEFIHGILRAILSVPLGQCKIGFLRCVLVLVTWTLAAAVSIRAQDATGRLPRFEDYPIKEVFRGKPAAPVLATAEQRTFRTRIRNGVSTGSDVWIGSYKNPIKAKGPNFAGHYFVIRWGCGSQCVLMAIVDAETGKVYDPPLADKNSLWVPLDNLSDMETDLRPDSSLLILRNACRDFKDRKTCGTYFFNWRDNHFDLVKFVYVNPLAGQRREWKPLEFLKS